MKRCLARKTKMPQSLFVSSLILLSALPLARCASQQSESTLAGDLEIARQYNEAGQFRKAVDALQALRRKHPKNPVVDAYLGYSYMGLNDFVAASRSYERAIELDPKNNDVRMNYAYSLIVQKRFADARKHLAIIEDDASYPYIEKVYVNQGLSYMEEKRCDLAYPKFEAAIKRDPVLTSAHYNNGRCYYSEKKYPQAISSFQLAYDACQGCIDPMLDMAKAYYKNGQGKLAQEKLNNILAKRPDPLTEARIKQILQENRK